jgi:hypothetical protein
MILIMIVLVLAALFVDVRCSHISKSTDTMIDQFEVISQQLQVIGQQLEGLRQATIQERPVPPPLPSPSPVVVEVVPENDLR